MPPTPLQCRPHDFVQDARWGWSCSRCGLRVDALEVARWGIYVAVVHALREYAIQELES